MKRGLSLLLAIFILLSVASVQAASPATVTSPWKYSFSTDATLFETGSDSESSSPYFYLNSGAKLIMSGGRGMTVQGALPADDSWRRLYLKENPLDTDDGFHPQNIFRLVTRSKWENTQQTAYFKITNDELSTSPNRAEHNGLLLMSRYGNSGDTLYYTGVRVDGNAIIKKKVNGKYETLASKKVFSGVYNRDTNPNLLPKNTWIGLRSQVNDNPDGSVTIKVYMDKNWNNNWVLIAEVTDRSNPIKGSGYAGIRTDFMDVTFDNYELANM